MDTHARHKAEKFWDRAAAGYDREEERDAKTYRRLIEKTKMHLESTDTLLDFGCGTGRVTAQVSDAVHRIHGIDFSSKMIELARANASKDNIEYLQADLFDIRLQTRTYDAVLAFYILHLTDDPKMALKRIYGLLKPGGRLLSATPCMGEKRVAAGLFSLLGKIGLLPAIHPFKKADLENLLTETGFRIIQSERLDGTSNQYLLLAQK